MKISLRSQALNKFLTTAFAVLTALLITFCYDLSAKENDPGFNFNSQSEYWPTKNWRASSPEKQGMDSETLAGVFDLVENFKIKINSLLVVRNGYVVLEGNRRKVGDLYHIYSSTKSFTSALIGIAVGNGIIKNIDQPISDFFPEILQKNEDPRKAAITLRHLLTMSGGFDWSEIATSYYDPANPAVQMVKSANPVEYILTKPMLLQPGLHYSYNSGCSHLLTAVLSKAGLDVSNFAQNNLFSPLGIKKNQYIWEQDPNHIPFGSHGLHMTPRNMAKFGYLFLKGGFWEGKQLIPKFWIAESTKKQIQIKFGIAEYYGFQWFIQRYGFHSLGLFGQYIVVVPKLEVVVVITSDLKQSLMAVPRKIVETNIIPAIKADKPLSENRKAREILEAAIEKFNKR